MSIKICNNMRTMKSVISGWGAIAVGVYSGKLFLDKYIKKNEKISDEFVEYMNGVGHL